MSRLAEMREQPLPPNTTSLRLESRRGNYFFGEKISKPTCTGTLHESLAADKFKSGCVIPISPASKGADYVEEFQSVRPSNGATNSCAAGLAAGAAGDDRRRDAIVAARRRGRARRQLLASGHLRKPRRRADSAGMVVLDDQLLYQCQRGEKRRL